MKIIFLDIDGVLNTSLTFEHIYREYEKTGFKRIAIDLNRLEYLKTIVERTGALIVLSSSWRFFLQKYYKSILPVNELGFQLLQLFYEFDLDIYDITPKDKNGIRQNEILSWMKEKEITNFVVIDDDSRDLQEFVDNGLIKTSFIPSSEVSDELEDSCGLCERHIEKAVEILNEKKEKYNRRLFKFLQKNNMK